MQRSTFPSAIPPAPTPLKSRRSRHELSYKVKERRIRFGIHIVLVLICITMIWPLLQVLSISLSDEKDIGLYGYSLIPHHFTLAAYQYILQDPWQVINAYKVSLIVTALGTILGVLIMGMLAYSLSRPQYILRRPLSFYVFFTMLFGGGMVASYILITQYLHMQDTLLVLFVPGLVSAWNVFLMRAYFTTSLPQELLEAARIDGANELRIFFQMVLPLSTPIFATVGTFTALGLWNDWSTPLIYINDPTLYPLQYLLYQIESNIQFLSSNANTITQPIVIPTETVRMAMVIIALGPIMLIFLYFQKYFVRGIALGSVKGD